MDGVPVSWEYGSERFGSVVMEETEVVAARFETKLLVARALVKYRFEPSATFVVRSPSELVASCCQEPPA